MSYIKEVYENLVKKFPEEKEFHQTAKEVLESLEQVIAENEELYRKNALLERLVEPERAIVFRVPWEDDKGQIHVNTGYRVQFNGAIGPYKGGLRFHPAVRLGTMKFLAFEQTFKNSLTGLPIGGGKGGSDFDPIGKSDNEIKRFCVSFMTELYRHIGPDRDVPAGDLGVSGKEIGYLFGQYRRIRGCYENGVITGKDLSFGGSKIRPEATGYGITYFLQEMLKDRGQELKGKTVAISGCGNVAWGAAKKMTELGAKVLTLSDPTGYVFFPDGLDKAKVDYMLEVRAGNLPIENFAKKFGVRFIAKKRPWEQKVDIAVPCATQNELDLEDAKTLLANGAALVCEGSNMPCTAEALEYLEKNGVDVGPSKAANAGGVAVSALEMSQDSIRYSWTEAEVEEKLHGIMRDIFRHCKEMCDKYKVSLVQGANIAGFMKVADAMLKQGNY
ncbi:MAG: NADP-specific glutamate dehydrogenase [Fusobacteriaceae bacterium]|jgi:glutamate dehydrogenase (NADP+)|nr:NADP-specific glutamate dehydrogenase [Fusobacteriaceae bacterium]